MLGDLGDGMRDSMPWRIRWELRRKDASDIVTEDVLIGRTRDATMNHGRENVARVRQRLRLIDNEFRGMTPPLVEFTSHHSD
jgi:hypothetical protein